MPLLPREEGWYAIDYDDFDEMGSYRIVVVAEDQPGLRSPQEIVLVTTHRLYLPAVIK